MIVPMKRVTVAMLRSHQEASLDALQDLGVLHLTSEQTDDSQGVAEARRRLDDLRRAADVLEAGSSTDPAAAPAPGNDLDAVVANAIRLADRLEAIDAEALALERERARLSILGDFDASALRKLARHGLAVRLLRARARWVAPDLDGIAVHELGRDGRERIVAVIGPAETLHDADLGQESGTSEPIAVPDEGPAVLRARLEALLRERRSGVATLRSLAQRRAEVRQRLATAEDALAFEEARAASAVAGPLAVIRGYCPAPRLGAVEAAAAKEGWGLFIEDVDDSTEVPTYITIPRWVRPIRALFSFTGVLPGYDQVDVSVPFLLFMSLFFAMIVGDAGYGLLFLALTELARWRMPNAPRAMVSLLRIMSVSTIVWGVLTGSYFGIGLLPHPLQAVQVTWLTSQSNMILLSFLIGAVHLTVAHGWNVVRFFPSPRSLAQLGWIFTTWTMFFLARAMVLGASFPHVMLYVLALGIVLIVAFMTPPKALKSEWFNHVMLPLSLVSNFVDLVSYVRLFAVGAATFAIAQAFNQMAAGGAGGVIAGATAALVLFFGHTLNILLATMGVLVHGVRLNMLEFASHLGMEWTGRPYRPFAHAQRQKEGA